MSKKKKEFKHIIIDMKNINDLETFLYVIINNAPLILSLKNLLETAKDKDFLLLPEILILNEALHNMENFWQQLTYICSEMQKRSKVSEEEVFNNLKKNMRNEVARIQKEIYNNQV